MTVKDTIGQGQFNMWEVVMHPIGRKRLMCRVQALA